MKMLPLFARAAKFSSRTAITDGAGDHTYRALLDGSAAVAAALLDGNEDLHETRVAFMVSNGLAYAQVQWGIWRAGGIAVPLCLTHPAPELEYVLDDAGASIVVADDAFAGTIAPLAKSRKLRFLLLSDALRQEMVKLPVLGLDRRAMILYTSGTTNKPKGVVTTHANIAAQIKSLVKAWGWTSDDVILHVLPMHHIHGIINVLSCALWSGARCIVLPRFDAVQVWEHLSSGKLTLFMAVPTIYNRLITAYDGAPGKQKQWSEGARKLRLMVSGSAALPVSTLERWKDITGHTLLERYGMTEIGMAISNPLNGERRPGCVGRPLPGVKVRLADDANQPVKRGTPGEIQVRGPGVFGEYWKRPQPTAESFTPDGFFRTGDVAVVERGAYRILGRSSVDIIKTGGEKVSALEIEEVLRTHPGVAECAVVGVPDQDWGERVCAALVMRNGQTMALETLRQWAKERLAPFKVPRQIRVVPDLPRNTMGKVTKPDVRNFFISAS